MRFRAVGLPPATVRSDYRRVRALPEVAILTKSCSTEHSSTAYRGRVPDLQQLIRSAVVARRPVDARERDSVASFLRLYDALEQPFSEQANKVHVTASAIVVTDDRRRVLLHLHKRMNMWLQPGGHIDAGELPWSAALREACEETGLPAQLVGPAIGRHIRPVEIVSQDHDHVGTVRSDPARCLAETAAPGRVSTHPGRLVAQTAVSNEAARKRRIDQCPCCEWPA